MNKKEFTAMLRELGFKPWRYSAHLPEEEFDGAFLYETSKDRNKIVIGHDQIKDKITFHSSKEDQATLVLLPMRTTIVGDTLHIPPTQQIDYVALEAIVVETIKRDGLPYTKLNLVVDPSSAFAIGNLKYDDARPEEMRALLTRLIQVNEHLPKIRTARAEAAAKAAYQATNDYLTRLG